MNSDKFLVSEDKKFKLKNHPPYFTGSYKTKEDAAEKLAADIDKLRKLHVKLYAENTYAILIILQGMDAAGKDSLIKHVISGVNPIGCRVTSFKTPSDNELDHDYLWRHVCALPARGDLGIFNRSYYEEVLVVRVHSQILDRERLPEDRKKKSIWNDRFRQINDFERYLVENGIEPLKFFLHISKEEQKRRFLSRLDAKEKNWKFSEADVKERGYWDDYQDAYEDMLGNTSTSYAPWHVIPSDQKWFAHLAVADILVQKLQALDLHYPKLTPEQAKALESARDLLTHEK